MRILELLMRYGPASRKKLALLLGVTSSSVTKTTAAMLEDRLVYEGEEEEKRSAGRKEVRLRLRSGAGYVLGLDLGPRRAEVTLLDFTTAIAACETVNYARLDEEALETAFAAVRRMRNRAGREPVHGLGLLVPGRIEDGQSLSLPIHDAKRRTELALDLPCTMRNNVRGLAAAEQFFAEPPDDFVLLKYGPGIGSVIVSGGQMLDGVRHNAGEMGHIAWPRRGTAAPCGVCGKPACLESACGFQAVLRNMGENADIAPSFAQVRAACVKDGGKVLRAALEDIARTAAVMIQAVDPQLVLLAGEIFTESYYFDIFATMLKTFSGGLAGVDISPVKDYAAKRGKAAGITAVDAYLRGGE
jgi:predicted NBD/HSP70 family sugar kinase